MSRSRCAVFLALFLVLVVAGASLVAAPATLYATTGTDGYDGIVRSCPPVGNEARTWTMWARSDTLDGAGFVGYYGGDATAGGGQLLLGREDDSVLLDLNTTTAPPLAERTVNSGTPDDGMFQGTFMAVDGTQNGSDPVFYQIFHSVTRVNGPGRLQRFAYIEENIVVSDRSSAATYEYIWSNSERATAANLPIFINSMVYDSVTGYGIVLGNASLRYFAAVPSPVFNTSAYYATLPRWVSMPEAARGLVLDTANRLLFFVVDDRIQSMPLPSSSNPFASSTRPTITTLTQLTDEYLYSMAIDASESTLYVSTRNCTAYAVVYAAAASSGQPPSFVSTTSINLGGVETTNTPAAIAVDPTGFCGPVGAGGNSSKIISGRKCTLFYDDVANAAGHHHHQRIIDVCFVVIAAAVVALAL